jgi:hypothetical protein
MISGQSTTIEDIEKHNIEIDGIKDACKHGLYFVRESTSDFLVLECIVCHKWAIFKD